MNHYCAAYDIEIPEAAHPGFCARRHRMEREHCGVCEHGRKAAKEETMAKQEKTCDKHGKFITNRSDGRCPKCTGRATAKEKAPSSPAHQPVAYGKDDQPLRRTAMDRCLDILITAGIIDEEQRQAVEVLVK